MVYIPPIGFKGTEFFVQNLKKNPPTGRLIVLSDSDYKNEFDWFPKPEFIKLEISPERLKCAEINRTSGISNALFICAMREAKKRNIRHVLYLESDCRLSVPNWDAVVFEEFHALNFPVIAAGTLMTWNIFNGGNTWVKPWQKLLADNFGAPCPVHSYGLMPNSFNGKDNPHNPTIFPNGAGMVISVDWAHELFGGFQNLHAIAIGEGQDGQAWDWQLGSRARQRFGPDVFSLFAHLKTVCSCYGDLVLTNEERLKLLREQKVMISHQHKGKDVV